MVVAVALDPIFQLNDQLQERQLFTSVLETAVASPDVGHTCVPSLQHPFSSRPSGTIPLLPSLPV